MKPAPPNAEDAIAWSRPKMTRTLLLDLAFAEATQLEAFVSEAVGHEPSVGELRELLAVIVETRKHTQFVRDCAWAEIASAKPEGSSRG